MVVKITSLVFPFNTLAQHFFYRFHRMNRLDIPILTLQDDNSITSLWSTTIDPLIQMIINLSLAQAVVPSNFKRAIVKPIIW